jgi:hypothetical protein
MAERALISAVLLVIVMSICLYMTECFVPIGRNMDFRDTCRDYLMRMEYNSGLGSSDCRELEDELKNMGFSDISITAPVSAKAGSVMTLSVNVIYTQSGLFGILERTTRDYAMNYERKAVARKVVNR